MYFVFTCQFASHEAILQAARTRNGGKADIASASCALPASLAKAGSAAKKHRASSWASVIVGPTRLIHGTKPWKCVGTKLASWGAAHAWVTSEDETDSWPAWIRHTSPRNGEHWGAVHAIHITKTSSGVRALSWDPRTSSFPPCDLGQGLWP